MSQELENQEVVEQDNNKIEEPVVEQPFEWGDLCIKCDCGNEMVLEKAVNTDLRILICKDGVRHLRLICDKCNAGLTLLFKPSSKEDINIKKQQIEEAKQNEVVAKNEEEPTIEGVSESMQHTMAVTE